MLREEKITAKKLNKFFASIITGQKLGLMPESELLLSGKESDELSHVIVTR